MIGIASLYKNKHKMVMVAKRFGTYVFLGNLGLSLRKDRCS
jgi:topoisomerase IA-like protein